MAEVGLDGWPSQELGFAFGKQPVVDKSDGKQEDAQAPEENQQYRAKNQCEGIKHSHLLWANHLHPGRAIARNLPAFANQLLNIGVEFFIHPVADGF